MSQEQSDEVQPKHDCGSGNSSQIRLKYEVLITLVSFLVSAIYAFASLQFRIEAQERAIISLCSKINILALARKEPYQLDCNEL